MIPKWTDGLEVLHNWCNLTMLTTTYKIIANILEDFFKPKVSALVGLQ